MSWNKRNISHSTPIRLWRWNIQSVPKRRHIKFRHAELPRRKHLAFRTRRKFEIKNFVRDYLQVLFKPVTDLIHNLFDICWLCIVYNVSLLLCPWARKLSRDGLEEAGCLYGIQKHDGTETFLCPYIFLYLIAGRAMLCMNIFSGNLTVNCNCLSF